MKNFISTVLASLIMISSSVFAADKIPGGYKPLSNLDEVIKESGGKKLIMLVVKGKDDKCPNCAEALKNGERAVGSGVMKVFARAEDLNAMDKSKLPASLQTRAAQPFTTNAWVTILVFDPKMDKIIAEASRTELQSNQKLTTEFKKTVQEAKQKLK